MKKIHILFTVLLALAGQVHAQTLIQYWHFNNLAPTHTSPVNPSSLTTVHADTSEGVTLGTFVYHPLTGTAGNALTYYDTTTGDTTYQQLGYAAGKALQLENPCDSMEARFYVPSGGYKDVVFGFGGKSMNGAMLLMPSYSIDSGASWLTSGIKSINGAAGSLMDTLFTNWQRNTIVFDTSIGNNNAFVVRLTFLGNTHATTGSTVIDNVTLSGTPVKVSVPATPTIYPVVIYPNPAHNTVNICTATNNEKNITIYNITGQTVYKTITKDERVTLSLSAFSPGMYHVRIQDTQTGTSTITKFEKE